MTHETTSKPTFLLSRWLFLRALGVVFAIAFVSLWWQLDGLFGSHGIIPAAEYFQAVQAGSDAWYQLPSICRLNTSDPLLHFCCAAGVAFSAFLILGVAPRLVLAMLWLLYLSLCIAGQGFFHFQWDTLLLETSLFAIFLAPAVWRSKIESDPPPSTLARWAIWWLLFKLMFLSGVTKLISGDPTWRDLSAMNFHYWTQPLPNQVSWYIHQLPDMWHKVEVVLTLICEIAIPIMIFFPRPMRHLAGIALIGLQVVLQVTGNFGFFNLLAITLCLPLFDDRFLRRLLPARFAVARGINIREVNHGWLKRVSDWILVLLICLSLLTFVREILRTRGVQDLPAPMVAVQRVIDENVLAWTDPFRSISGYGLFRVMTTSRLEITVEGSNDGINWSSYEFKWKPGDPLRAPGFVTPHMPRLDWQMWFAGLNPAAHENMLTRLLNRIHEDEPGVLRLLDENPFPDESPRFLRLVLYQYEFTDSRERKETGQWWKREWVETSEVISK